MPDYIFGCIYEVFAGICELHHIGAQIAVQRVRDRTGDASKVINNNRAHPSAVGRWRIFASCSRAKGAKLTNEQIATGIIERECFDPKLADAALDPRCFALEGGPSIAEQN